MTPVTRINHVGISVDDMDEALVFWQELLGLELEGRGEVTRPHLDEIVGVDGIRIEWAELAVPAGGKLELFRYLEPRGDTLRQRPWDTGAQHVCMEVTSIRSLVERMQAAGIELRSRAPVTIPVGDWHGWTSVYVVGPGGVTVELVEPPERAAGEECDHGRW